MSQIKGNLRLQLATTNSDGKASTAFAEASELGITPSESALRLVPNFVDSQGTTLRSGLKIVQSDGRIAFTGFTRGIVALLLKTTVAELKLVNPKDKQACKARLLAVATALRTEANTDAVGIICEADITNEDNEDAKYDVLGALSAIQLTNPIDIEVFDDTVVDNRSTDED